ncbi:MAG: helix-turn-helix transcriptional regulator [Dehalococcoidia bacterium]|nr:helix-turn-helix transcriptional regulator [Dehalococcoidia bacterium]
MTNNYPQIGVLLKQQRVSVPLTLQELARKAKVSASHLGRVERGQRFPSAKILRRLAGPLGLEENEIFTLAGYLSPQAPSIAEDPGAYHGRYLDPLVSKLLSQEPVEVQRQVISILNILKSLARTTVNAVDNHKHEVR